MDDVSNSHCIFLYYFVLISRDRHFVRKKAYHNIFRRQLKFVSSLLEGSRIMNNFLLRNNSIKIWQNFDGMMEIISARVSFKLSS